MTRTTSKIKAAQERIQQAGGAHIGDLATWNASGVDINREACKAILESEGFGHHAPTMSAASALTRESGNIERSTGVMVRPFARHEKDSPIAVGFYIQKGNDGESGDDYVCGARARINANGDVVALPPANAPAIKEAMDAAEQVVIRANHRVKNALTVDVCASLIEIVKELGGVTLRDRGGFYLVPVASCDRWRRLSALFEPHGIERVLIEMHDAPSNVKACAGAAKGSLEAEIATLTADLAKAQEDGMRTKSLDRRVKICEELTAKAELYRNVLQDAASGIAERLATLRAGFAKALEATDEDDFKIAVND